MTLDLGSLSASVDQAMANSPSDTATPPATPAQVMRELARPPVGDRSSRRASFWSQLRRVRLHDAALTIFDRQFGTTWQVPALSVELERQGAGGVQGHAEATLTLGDQTATLTATATLGRDGQRTAVTAALTPLVPAALADLVPQAAPLAALTAPVTLSAMAELDAALQPTNFSAHAEAGAGKLLAGTGSMPLLGATLTAEGTPDAIRLRLARLDLAARPDGARTLVRAQASATRIVSGGWHAVASLDLDAVAFADLPVLWPRGVGGNGTRPWIVKNITDGVVRNGHVDLVAEAAADLSDLRVTRVAGGLDGEGLTVHWLRPVPPIEHVEAHLAIAGTDTLEATFTAGRQAGGSQGGIRIRAGHVIFTGLNDPDQLADIEGDLAGPIADAIALLRVPKVGLLQKSALDLHDASGQVTAKVTVTHLPLRDAISMDDVNIRASAQLTAVHVGGLVAGHDLDRGTLTLDAAPDGMHVAGHAVVAGVPAQLQVAMDFRAGPPTQVTRSVTASGDLDEHALSGIGLDTQGLLVGPSAATATLTFHRDGQNTLAVGADLTRAALRVEPLGFVKPAGQPARLEALIGLDGERLNSVDRLHAEGSGLRLDATAAFSGGKPALVRLDRLVLGSTTDVHGEVRPPPRAGDPWLVTLAGPSLDVSAAVARKPAPPRAEPQREAPPGPAYVVDGRFDRVVLGAAGALGGVVVHAENDGLLLKRAALSGRTGAAPGVGVFQASITPQGHGRRLSGSSADAGGLLRAMDILATMQGGRMTLTGRYDDSRPDHPLDGTAVIEDFHIRRAPTLAKLLQAMTLYGLVDAISGPGLGFSKLEAPFRLASNVLTLRDARAFSASLGMTAKGEVDLGRQTVDLEGTIVPAYFFNSLLGDIPLLGRLFSPERGGGLFAATYAVGGQLDDPTVAINPLAALTPGFLRGLFGAFDATDAPRVR